ncbi:MAG: hypothetical protein DMG14_20515 [Acidobacteria bacterium]|nr:MAG: hypothetical protein DMG14_20515 [Acidobacteriota bacterium]
MATRLSRTEKSATRKPERRSAGGTAKAPDAKPGFRRPGWWIVVFLVAINLLAYAPVRHYGFVNIDDPQYLTQNPQVKSGLSWHGVLWAFTTGHQANWHPLTWLSHMLDVQLYGFNAGAHHLTNLLLHIANTLLLFWALFQMTRALGRSAFVAALFAVHPLHVESVAWVAERKDVLSTLFWMLTVCAYIGYVRQPRSARYLAVISFFAVGLMAKPMLVTLPFVLLLLDFWPLGRLTLRQRSNFPKLIREKIPFLILTAISSAVTMFAQRRGGAMVGVDVVPMTIRLANACVAYFTYFWKMFWPTGMAVLYPTPIRAVPDWWLVAAIGLIVLSVLAIKLATRRPYVFVGWFWFLGTLVPVIGLVQVGRQAMADRYTYVPLVGLFLIVAFGLGDALASPPARRRVLMTAGGLVIVSCVWATRVQLRYWSSSEALWEHTIRVTTDNAVAHFSLAVAFTEQGKPDEAMREYSEALRIVPQYAEAHYNIAEALTKSGKTDAAIAHYSEALRLAKISQTGLDQYQLAAAHHDLALAFSSKGNMEEAGAHLAEALRMNPNFPEAHNSFGIHYLIKGNADEAIAHFAEAIRLKPDYAVAHNNLGSALANKGRLEDAISEYAEAVRVDRSYADAHTNLGILLAKEAKTTEAISHFSEALRINSNDQVARGWLTNLTSKTSATR